MNVENSKFSNDDERPAASGRDGPNVTLIVLAIVMLLFIVFFLQNSRELNVNFLLFERTTTVRWSLLIAVAFGIALDRVFTMWWRRRKARKSEA